MSLIIRPPWTRQPQHSIAIDWSKPITRGLKVVILPSLGWQAKDLARGLGYSAFSGGAAQAPVVIGSPGKAFRSDGYLYNQYISIPSWVNTNEGSALIIRSGAGVRLWELGDSGNSDEFPYGGLVYTDAFWSGRWANGVAPPSGKQFDVPLTIAVSVKEGRQVAFWDAEKWWSNNQSGGFTLPSSLQFGASASGPSGGTHDTYLALAWDRALSDAELKSVSENPWQIFKPPPRRIWVAPSGGAVNGTGSGSLSQSNLSPVLGVGSSTSDATGIGSLDDISLQAILANASSSVTGSGLLSSLSLSSVSGSAQVSATAVSTLVSIILAAVSGSASTTGAGTATGALPLLSLSSLGALAAGSGNANASFDDLSLNAPQATAFTGAVGSGDLAGISLSSPSVIASGNALTTAALRAISLGVVNASATSGAPQILTQADIDAIVTALLTDPRLLTVAKFLALK